MKGGFRIDGTGAGLLVVGAYLRTYLSIYLPHLRAYLTSRYLPTYRPYGMEGNGREQEGKGGGFETCMTHRVRTDEYD